MKNLIPAILIAAAAAVASIKPEQAADPILSAIAATPVVAASPSPGLDFEDLAKRSPVCDCDPAKKCPCADCVCNTVPEAPLTVGRPPDLVNLVALKSPPSIAATPARVIAISEPPPGLIVPTKHPAAPAAPRPAAKPAIAGGQWVTRYAGVRGRRSYVEWIPHNMPAASQPPAAACNFSGGACRSCR